MNESINDVLMKDFKLCVKSLKKSEKKCEKLQQENQQLKDRIDKAIEYLKRKENMPEWYDTDFMICINILNGGSGNFEDIEEFFAGAELDYNENAPEYKINQLIKNQRKIIEMLKEDK